LPRTMIHCSLPFSSTFLTRAMLSGRGRSSGPAIGAVDRAPGELCSVGSVCPFSDSGARNSCTRTGQLAAHYGHSDRASGGVATVHTSFGKPTPRLPRASRAAFRDRYPPESCCHVVPASQSHEQVLANQAQPDKNRTEEPHNPSPQQAAGPLARTPNLSPTHLHRPPRRPGHNPRTNVRGTRPQGVYRLKQNPSDEGKYCARCGTRTAFQPLKTLESRENMRKPG
jgi:hypothetical protein